MEELKDFLDKELIWEDVLRLIKSREEAECLLNANILCQELICHLRSVLAGFQHVQFQESCHVGALESGNPYNNVLALLLQRSVSSGNDRLFVMIQNMQSIIDEIVCFEGSIRDYSLQHINFAKENEHESSTTKQDFLLLSEIEIKFADRIKHVLKCATERIKMSSPIETDNDTKKRKLVVDDEEYRIGIGIKESRSENEESRSPLQFQSTSSSQGQAEKRKSSSKELNRGVRTPLSNITPPNSQQDNSIEILCTKSQGSSQLSEEIAIGHDQ